MTLTEAEWAASKTKDNYLSEKYLGLAHRRGQKRAIMAVSHKILCIGYNVVEKKEPYNDLFPNYLEQIHKENSKRNAVNRLRSLGFKVCLISSKPVS